MDHLLPAATLRRVVSCDRAARHQHLDGSTEASSAGLFREERHTTAA